MTALTELFDEWGGAIWKATIETFQMVSIALIISLVIGLFLAILLVLTRPNKALENKFVFQVLKFFLANWASDLQGLGPKSLISKPSFSSLFATTVIYLSNSGEKHI